MHKHRYREHIRMHTYAYICTHAHMHTHTCRHMHTYAHRCTHAHIRMQTYAHICTHAHIHMHTYAHICTLLPYQVFCSVQVVAQCHTRFAMSKRMVQTGVEEWQEEENEDLSDCSPADVWKGGEHSDLSDDPEALVEAGEIPPTTVQAWLNIVQDASRLKAQKAQALKQAKHWQASCQKERAKHMKLKKDYEQLMKENNEYKAAHQKLGAWMSLGQAQFTKASEVGPEFQLMSPHYDEPVKVLTDLQRPMPTPPSTPPPMYLMRQFKSKPKASLCTKKKGLCKKDGSPNTSFNRASIGGRMGKQAHPIGGRIRKQSRPWAKAPPIEPGAPGQGSFIC